MSTAENHSLAGVRFRVYKKAQQATALSGSLAVLFLLHGRHGSLEGVDSAAKDILEKATGGRTLWIITLDHRNHGTRAVDTVRNNAWTEEPPNERHAIDMYAIQDGTARDVSFLMDFLPGYFFPSDEATIDVWGVAGISLGGHSTWILLGEDERIQVGIPIIGCPDYVELMKYRAKNSGIAFDAPHIPAGFLKSMEKTNPASKNYRSAESNPFLGKKILVLSGADDKLVPWIASKEFVETLEVGAGGVKEVILQAGAGHKFTKEMAEAAGRFVDRMMVSV